MNENNAVNPGFNTNHTPDKKLEKFELVKGDYMFSIFAFVISVITSILGIWGGFRIGWTISVISIIVILTAYFISGRSKVKLFPLCCALFAVAVSLSFTLTTNGMVRFFSFIFAAILSLIWFMSLIAEQKEEDDLDLIINIFSPIFELVIPCIPNSVVSLFSGNGEKNKKLGKALIGCLISVPFLFVIIPLLIASDEAFSGMVGLFFGNIVSTLFKIIVGAVISLLIISYGFSFKKRALPERKKCNFAGVEGITVGVFLSVISLCYLSYLFSQLAYFFSAFSGFLPENYKFSVSAYARRGFFEMSVIAALNLLIIFIVLILTKKRDCKIGAGIKALCTFIAVFTLLIISTALSKMALYIKSLGMTELRVGTSGFMIALWVIFISLIVRIYIPKIRVIRTALISFAVVLTLFGCFNINSVIGEYNYNAYKNGWTETIDTRALYYLGPEGIPYLIKLSEDKDKEVSFEAEKMLYNALLYGNYEYKIVENVKGPKLEKNENRINGLGSYCYPLMRAEKMLNEFIENNGNFLSKQWKHRYSDDSSVYYTIY
ncbi:MAG: DUF4173 domain-containing protein [Clostridia bacterium]|nr:DUF4173 domain-containing protein [Clostridia bacterium]